MLLKDSWHWCRIIQQPKDFDDPFPPPAIIVNAHTESNPLVSWYEEKIDRYLAYAIPERKLDEPCKRAILEDASANVDRTILQIAIPHCIGATPNDYAFMTGRNHITAPNNIRKAKGGVYHKLYQVKVEDIRVLARRITKKNSSDFWTRLWKWIEKWQQNVDMVPQYMKEVITRVYESAGFDAPVHLWTVPDEICVTHVGQYSSGMWMRVFKEVAKGPSDDMDFNTARVWQQVSWLGTLPATYSPITSSLNGDRLDEVALLNKPLHSRILTNIETFYIAANASAPLSNIGVPEFQDF